MNRARLSEMKSLEKENQRLKKIVADLDRASNQGGGLLSPNVATNAAIFPGRLMGR